MTQTTHGHHIPYTPRDDEHSTFKARCGGPGICEECSREAQFFLNKKREDFEEVVSEKHNKHFYNSQEDKEKLEVLLHKALNSLEFGTVEYTKELLREALDVFSMPIYKANIIQHARDELDKRGDTEESIEAHLRIISSLADFEPYASISFPVITSLIQFKNLSPLTTNPEEWTRIGESIWMSNRNHSCFSNDGGITYWSIDDGSDGAKKKKIYKSKKVSKVLPVRHRRGNPTK